MPRVCTTKYGESSFCYEAVGVCNSLPNDLGKVEEFKEFRRLAALRANVQCALFHFRLGKFYFSLLYTCSALLCLTFILL